MNVNSEQMPNFPENLKQQYHQLPQLQQQIQQQLQQQQLQQLQQQLQQQIQEQQVQQQLQMQNNQLHHNLQAIKQTLSSQNPLLSYPNPGNLSSKNMNAAYSLSTNEHLQQQNCLNMNMNSIETSSTSSASTSASSSPTPANNHQLNTFNMATNQPTPLSLISPSLVSQITPSLNILRFLSDAPYESLSHENDPMMCTREIDRGHVCLNCCMVYMNQCVHECPNSWARLLQVLVGCNVCGEYYPSLGEYKHHVKSAHQDCGYFKYGEN